MKSISGLTGSAPDREDHAGEKPMALATPSPGRSWWWLVCVLFALTLVTLQAWTNDLIGAPLSGDRGISLHIAQDGFRDSLPHEQNFDYKPPGYSVLSAAFLAGVADASLLTTSSPTASCHVSDS